jgi:hypothetical protein
MSIKRGGEMIKKDYKRIERLSKDCSDVELARMVVEFENKIAELEELVIELKIGDFDECGEDE